MENARNFYIDGAWVAPQAGTAFDVIDPSNEEVVTQISLGGEADTNAAVAAAKAKFPTWRWTSKAERLELMENILAVYTKRSDDMAHAISREMGAPVDMAKVQQSGAGAGHIKAFIQALKEFTFEHPLREGEESTNIIHEPIGVCALITPWNWPMNQIALKVMPAIATGCTMVLKPSEQSPLSGILFSEIMHEAGVPAGVYNMVNGDGPTVGAALSRHPDVDMMSFTGSTRAGGEVAKAAAPTVKRVAQELGGKSANILLEDADLATAVSHGVFTCMMNSGQSCNAPTRMLVPQNKVDEAVAIAQGVVAGITPGDPTQDGTVIGPVVSDVQWQKIQGLIQQGIDEGARLVAGGPGKPEGLETGYYVKPTIFADVTNDMTIAREEIFGPVLCILPYKDEKEAVAIANDTPYGLSGYVSGGALDRAKAVAGRLRTGNVHLNGATANFNAPFGGYKQSGNGREWGEFGLEEFLETKALIGTAG